MKFCSFHYTHIYTQVHSFPYTSYGHISSIKGSEIFFFFLAILLSCECIIPLKMDGRSSFFWQALTFVGQLMKETGNYGKSLRMQFIINFFISPAFLFLSFPSFFHCCRCSLHERLKNFQHMNYSYSSLKSNHPWITSMGFANFYLLKSKVKNETKKEKKFSNYTCQCGLLSDWESLKARVRLQEKTGVKKIAYGSK